MKAKIIKAFAIVATTGLLAACSSDYLDVTPETLVSSGTVQTTEEGAQQALNGLCQTMYCPVTDYFSDYLYPNGEPYIATVYGEVLSQDYFSYLWASGTGTNYTWAANNFPSGWLVLQGWSYCYNLINQANVILDGIDTIEGDRDHLDFIKAQALTVRAHAYIRLLMSYAPRWQDSNNGEKYTVVLRLHAGTEDVPLSTMNEVLASIYNDCETAIKLFEDCGLTRTYTWEPNVAVAQGLFARAAMLKEDWPKAQEMAAKSRKNYPIMTADEYKAGFCKPNREWIWEAYEDNQFGYAAYGTMYACNGTYPGLWGEGAGCINYDLYRQFPEGDIRSDLFFTPDKLVGTRVKPAAFWHEKWCDPTSMNLLELNPLMKGQIEAYQNSHYPTDTSVSWPAPYTNFQTGSNEGVLVGFGAQYKFWALDNYGTGSWCVMRGAEMLLNEAEAAYHNGQPAVAIANLKELNAQRNENYDCNLSGQALLDEIRLQRRFELWGEGFSFFDLKRWNLPMVRNVWVANDVDSNNVPQAYGLKKEADDKGWKFAVPISESRYNKLVDRTLVDD